MTSLPTEETSTEFMVRSLDSLPSHRLCFATADYCLVLHFFVILSLVGGFRLNGEFYDIIWLWQVIGVLESSTQELL